MFVLPFSKGSKGILAPVFWQVFKNKDLEGLLEKLRLQCLEPWGDVDPAQLRERSDGWPCLRFPFWEMTQSQLCCLEMHRGNFSFSQLREAGTWALCPAEGAAQLYTVPD